MVEKTDLTEVKNFIKGKRVAIVGNSTSIFDTKYGKDIDKHDVVIRFNKGFPIKPTSQGSKTDILMLACKLTRDMIKRYHAKYTIRRLNIPYYNYKCDFTFTDQFIKKISKDLGARSSTGLMAIEFALECEAKSIDVYGFTFFNDSTFYNPVGYQTKHSPEGEERRILGYYEEGKLNLFPKPSVKKKKFGEIKNVCLDKMEIVYAFDKNYLPYFELSAASVLKYNPNAHITVVSPEPLGIDKKFNNIVMQPIDAKNIKYKNNPRITESSYLRLYLPELPYKKILYMDADVLCLQPLGELWNNECPYICVTESHRYGTKQAAELGHEKYGLAGVMLMNLEEMRNDDFTEKAFNPFESNVQFWQQEETILNYWFYDKMTFIDKKYNYCFNRQYVDPIAPCEVTLLHFPGAEKKMMKHIYDLYVR